jgi:hypothetical protein
MRRIRTGALLALALLVCTPALRATTARALSDQELAQTASVIAIGRCAEIKSAWEGGTLVTLATIAVEESLKGAPGAELTVTLPGGIDSNRKFPVSVVWPGAPTVRVGEEVFLFLVPDEGPTASVIVAGFSQGKFSIGRDTAGRKYVSRDLSTLQLQDERGVSRGNRVQKPLDQFKAEILGYLKGV